MKPEIKTRAYVACPECGEGEFIVQHLLGWEKGRKAGAPWYCHNDACRAGWQFSMGEDGTLEIERADTGKAPGYGLLKLGDLYLVHHQKYGNYVDSDSADYMYHSHQCPTDILGEIEAVFNARGSDPHGVMRYVTSILDTPETTKALEETGSLQALFALFKTDGQPAPTNWPEENGGVIPWIAEMQRDHEKKGDG